MAQMPKTIGRVPVEDKILDLEVCATPLAFERSQPLIPDVIRFLTMAGSIIGLVAQAGVKGLDDIMKLLPLIGRLDPQKMGEMMELLNKHHRAVLSATVVVMPHPVSGELENFELSDDKRRKMVFDEHPDLYVPIVIFAGKATFARFFPATGQRGDATPTPES